MTFTLKHDYCQLLFLSLYTIAFECALLELISIYCYNVCLIQLNLAELGLCIETKWTIWFTSLRFGSDLDTFGCISATAV